MKKLLLIIFLLFISCDNNPIIVKGKFKTPNKYIVYVGKYPIYVDSLSFEENKKLGNKVNILDSKYYILDQDNYYHEVTKYKWKTLKRLDTLK